MVFKKGHKVNQGRVFSEETKEKISNTLKGRKIPKEQVKRQSTSLKKAYKEGRVKQVKHTKETKEKISKTRKQRIKEGKIKFNPWNKGKKLGEKHKEKLRGRTSPKKGKSYEEYYGKERAKEIKKKLSEAHKGLPSANKGNKYSEEKKKEMSKITKKFINKPEVIRKIREARAKQVFPKHNTKIEKKIQKFLDNNSIEYKKHHPIMNIEHCYNCDVFIPSMNLIIECDGNYWHNYPKGKKLDKIRNKELKNNGYNVIRIWGSDINNNFNQVCNKLRKLFGYMSNDLGCSESSPKQGGVEHEGVTAPFGKTKGMVAQVSVSRP